MKEPQLKKKDEEALMSVAEAPAPEVVEVPAPVETRKPKDWEPPYIHIRDVKITSVKIDGLLVNVGFDNADDAQLFYSSLQSRVGAT